MKAAKVISAILTLLITVPIWVYLIYQIMVRVQASELMWFLFWIYVPAHILANVIFKVANDVK